MGTRGEDMYLLWLVSIMRRRFKHPHRKNFKAISRSTLECISFLDVSWFHHYANLGQRGLSLIGEPGMFPAGAGFTAGSFATTSLLCCPSWMLIACDVAKQQWEWGGAGLCSLQHRELSPVLRAQRFFRRYTHSGPSSL